MLKNKTVLLCISGGIAAYKMAHVASALKKQHCNVHVIMTENATNFTLITPCTFGGTNEDKCVVLYF
ncbi:MAG: flavoprotein [Eubacteriales bacterium]